MSALPDKIMVLKGEMMAAMERIISGRKHLARLGGWTVIFFAITGAALHLCFLTGNGELSELYVLNGSFVLFYALAAIGIYKKNKNGVLLAWLPAVVWIILSGIWAYHLFEVCTFSSGARDVFWLTEQAMPFLYIVGVWLYRRKASKEAQDIAEKFWYGGAVMLFILDLLLYMFIYGASGGGCLPTDAVSDIFPVTY